MVAIRAGKLVAPGSGTVLTNQTIPIRDGEIEPVGGNVTIPSNAKIIDLEGNGFTRGRRKMAL